MIKWLEVVNAVHASLLKNKVSLRDARVGDFEFGGISVTHAVLVNVDKDTGAIVILDASAHKEGTIPSTNGVKPTISWLEFVGWVEEQCLVGGFLPSETAISHLEIRPGHVSELSVFVDDTFKTLCITDTEERINGLSLTSLV